MAVPMWHPTTQQWHVIWASTLLMLIAFLASDPEPHRFVLPGAAIGLLFVWNVSGR